MTGEESFNELKSEIISIMKEHGEYNIPYADAFIVLVEWFCGGDPSKEVDEYIKTTDKYNRHLKNGREIIPALNLKLPRPIEEMAVIITVTELILEDAKKEGLVSDEVPVISVSENQLESIIGRPDMPPGIIPAFYDRSDE